MPVGKVFNAAENQVLISPVSNFYQGKAIRAGLREQELDIATKEKNLDLADKKMDLEKKRIAIAENEMKLRNEQYDLNREKFEAEVGEEQAKKYAFHSYSINQEVDRTFADGGRTPESEAAALALAAERYTEYAQTLPDGEQKSALMEKLQGGITADEYRQIRPAVERQAQYYGFIDKGENVILSEGAQLRGPNGELIAENEKNFAPSSSKDSINFEPISNGERQAAEKALKTVDVLDDLPSSQKRVAAEMLANDIRQLQANLGKSYAEAMQMALAGLVAKVDVEPDFFTGTDSKLDLQSGGLEPNEFLVNGEIFIRDEDGSIRAKD
jgi:hypothetical protein